jgi:hypothetical protein
MQYAGPMDLNVLRELIPSKEILDHLDAGGRCALTYACDKRDFGAMRLLLECGADPQVLDPQGLTIVQRLWRQLASVHVYRKISAAQFEESVRMLLEHGFSLSLLWNDASR